MKKFLIKTTLFSVVIVIILNALMISFLFGVKDDWSINSHECNYILSYNRLSQLKDTNKIVIIAGSNGGFSINSKMIQDAIHIPVVNTSTHAGLGVRMQFETYKELLRKGDIVLFIPEYDDDNSRLYGNSTLFRIVGTHMPSAYKNVTIKQWIHLYKYIGIHNKECYDHRGSDSFTGPYSRKALNKFGDIDIKREHQDSIKSYNLTGNMDEELIEYYKYIRNFLKKKEIQFIFLPPTLIETCYKNNKNQIDSVQVSLRQNGIPFDALPSRYVFPDSLYFDTPYHMIPIGAKIRTERLIEDIKRLKKMQ